MNRLVAVLMSALVIGGCPQQESDSTVGPNVDEGSGRVVTTSIAPGIYVGDLRLITRTRINGDVVDEKAETMPYNEVVDEHGLPLMQPGGDVPRVGLTLSSTMGDATVTMQVESVSASGNRLVIAYSVEFYYSSLDMTLTGLGTSTYTFIEPSTLEYVDTAFAGAVVDTDSFRIDILQSATLRK